MWIVIAILVIAVIALCVKLSEIESELGQIKARLGEPKPAAKVPPTPKEVVRKLESPSAPPPVLVKAVVKAKVPEKPKAERKSFDWEKLLMGNMFNKLGAIALIVGVAIFIKLISPFFVFTPLRQVIGAYGLGLLLTFGAWRIHKKEMKAYAEVLMGTGFAIFFVATYGATSFYHLMPDWLALGVGTALVLASYGVAHRFKTLSTMLIGLIAAYANPLIIGSMGSQEFLFTYFIFTNAITVAYVCVNKGKWLLHYINLPLTALYLLGYSLYQNEVSFVFPLMLWLVYMVSDAVSMRQGYKPHHWGVSILNYILLMVVAVHEFAVDDGYIIELVLTGFGLMYLLMSYLSRKSASALSLIYCSSGMLALLVAPYFIDQETLRLCIWAGTGLFCALLGVKPAVPHFEKWSLGFLLSASIAALYSLVPMPQLELFFNLRSLHLGVVTIALLGSALLLWRSKPTFAHLMSFAALLLSYVYVMEEIADGMQVHNLTNYYASSYINAMVLASFVAAAMGMYGLTRLKLFALSAYGVWFFIACAFLETVYCEHNLEGGYPFANMGLAALVAIFSAGFYLARAIRYHMAARRIGFAYVMEWAIFSLAYLWLVFQTRCFDWSGERRLFVLINFAWVAALRAQFLCAKLRNPLLGIMAHMLFYGALYTLVVEGSPYLDSVEITPFLNWGCLTYSLGAATAILLARLSQRVIPEGYSFYAPFLRFLAFIQLSVALVIEVARVTGRIEGLSDVNEVGIYLMTAFAFVVAARLIYTKSRFALYHLSYCIVYPISAIILMVAGVVEEAPPLVTMLSLAFAILIALTCYFARSTKHPFFPYFAILAGFLWIGAETRNLTLDWTEQAAQIALSVAWILYSALLMVWGIFKNSSCLKISGTLIIICSILKILFYDLSRVDALSKTIAFLLLGLVLLAVSYFYTRNKKG